MVAAISLGGATYVAADVYSVAVRASGSEKGNPPLAATDGNTTTRWSCSNQTSPCWLRLDLGVEKPIDDVAITWFNGGSVKYDFSIDVAGADLNYETVVARTSAGNTPAAESYAFAATTGRYVRITVSDDSVHSGHASIVETGASGGAAPATTATPASAPTPTPPLSTSSDAGQPDAFGIVKKYATASDALTWTSAHWANGHARDITGRDPDDPTGVSESRSDQATLHVDGQGVLQFKGSSSASEPRLHLNGGSRWLFKNTEATFYYRKDQDYDVDWGGMVIGVRSGPDGHSSTTQFCDAHTYYGRFRNDGKYDFEKELKHPASSVRSGANMWGGATDLPTGQWIGMKYVVYNVTVGGQPGVKLELYRDTSGGANGGTWTKIGETVDTGGWAPQNSGACTAYPADFVPLTGGGVIVLRNTGVVADSYKWMSVREVVPPAS